MEQNRQFESFELPHEGYSLCMWVRERLPDLQEGFLDAIAAETVRAHLSVCFLCAKEYNELEATVRLIESLPFVEPHKDHTATIMAAIQAQSGHSFRSPVVEMEIAALNRLSEPRTTNGLQRQDQYDLAGLGISLSGKGRFNRHAESSSHLSGRDRVILFLGLFATLLALIPTLGRALIGGSPTAPLARIAESPVVGAIGGFVVNLIQSVGSGAAQVFQTVSAKPATMLLFDAAVLAAAYYAWMFRTQRGYQVS